MSVRTDRLVVHAVVSLYNACLPPQALEGLWMVVRSRRMPLRCTPLGILLAGCVPVGQRRPVIVATADTGVSPERARQTPRTVDGADLCRHRPVPRRHPQDGAVRRLRLVHPPQATATTRRNTPSGMPAAPAPCTRFSDPTAVAGCAWDAGPPGPGRSPTA